MPRVYVKTKSNRGAHPERYKCVAPNCKVAAEGGSRQIQPGEKYYIWERRFGRYGQTYHQHVACGRPKPTQLSSRKTAYVEEAIGDIDLGQWNYELPEDFEPADVVEIEVDDLVSLLEPAADAAESCADEYEDGVSNMPEGLQYGPTGEAMTQVAEELREWAENIRDFQPDTTCDLPDPESYDGDMDACRNDAEQAVSDFVAELVSEAEATLEDMPEYQG